MSKIILTSSVADVGYHLPTQLDRHASEYQLLFVTTAAEGEPGGLDSRWLSRDKQGLLDAGFQLTEYSITDKTKAELKHAVAQTDILFVNGGNTFYLLYHLRHTRFDEVIQDFLQSGGIYASSSAGSIIAGVDIEPSRRTENVHLAPKLKSTRGLGFVDFAILPHWGGKSFKKLYMNHRLEHAYTGEYPVMLLGDKQYLVKEKNVVSVINVFSDTKKVL